MYGIRSLRNWERTFFGLGFLQKSVLKKRYLHLSRTLENVSCAYRHGYAVLTLPLPSRTEDCEFSLLPASSTVKSLISNIQQEDGGIDRAAIYSMEGNRVSGSTPIDILLQSDFKITINEKEYDVITPKPESFPINHEDQLSTVKNLISQLYTDVNVHLYKENRERVIASHLEILQKELEPLEKQKATIDMKAAQRTNVLVWAGLGYMSLQFGFLARLTWWEYSWDIMEPVTFFVTYATSMVMYAYFVLTREDCNYPEVKSRSHLLSFHKESDRIKFDVNGYNAKKDQVAKLEHELKLLKTPPVFVDMNKVVDS